MERRHFLKATGALALSLSTLGLAGRAAPVAAQQDEDAAIWGGNWLLWAEIYQVRAVRCGGIDSNSKPDLRIKVDGFSKGFRANRCNRDHEDGSPIWTVGFFQSRSFTSHKFKIEVWDRDDGFNGKDDHLDVYAGSGKDLHMQVIAYTNGGATAFDEDNSMESWFHRTNDPKVYQTSIFKSQGSNALVRFRLKLERVNY
jgi:hypothetical protein